VGRWVRVPEVLWRSTSRGPVVLPRASDDAELLGGLGAVVWELLDVPSTEGDLVAALSDFAFADELPTTSVVSSALGELRERGLVEDVSGADR